MINSISKKTKIKTKHKSKSKSKTQKGSGIIYKTPSRYTNIRYTKGGHTITKLTCPVCRADVFKMRTMKLATQKKAVIFSVTGFGNAFNNKFRFFTCTNCGKVEVYSNNIALNETSA
jgi:predicted nucleic-acid-binding Zn-ribbon protein